jgi:hypothetical protein
MGFINQFLDDAKPDSFQNALSAQTVNVAELARRTLNVETLQQITPMMGTRLDTLGHVGVTKLNRILFFSAVEATPFITVPPDALTGSNIFEVILTGQFFQNTGSTQTVTPKFYIGKAGSETLVTSDTALSVANGTVRKSFEYRIRVTAAPAGGTKVQVDEKFDLENATAGSMSTIMRSTRTAVIDITQLSEIDSCFIRIINGATASMFRIFTNTVSVQVLDAVQANEIHWYSQPTGSDGIDTPLNSSAPTTNYSTSVTIWAGESYAGSLIARSLIKFSEIGNFLIDPDLMGFQVSEAYLYLTVSADDSFNARNCDIFRVLVDWDEAVATWNIRKAATNWGAAGLLAGTDYNSTAIASTSFSASETAGIVKSFSLDVPTIQAMIDGTYPNYGFLIKMQTEINDEYLFHSSNSATPDFAPILYLIGTRPN